MMQVGDKGVSCLQSLLQLKVLGLQGTAVTCASMAVVGALSGLHALDLAWTAVGSQGIQHGLIIVRLAHRLMHKSIVTCDLHLGSAQGQQYTRKVADV